MFKSGFNLKSRPFFYTSLVLVLVAVTFSAALLTFQWISGKEKVEGGYVSLNEGWEYKWDEGTSNNGTGTDFDKVAEGDWKNYSITGKPLKNQNENNITWFRVKVPDNSKWDTLGIYFELMLSKKVEAYIDGNLIFKDDTYVLSSATSYVLSRDRLVIPLQKEFTGKILYLRVYSDMESIGPYRNAYIGQYNEVTKLFINEDMDTIILGFFLIVFGLFILPNVIFVDKKDRKSLVYLSCFIFFLGGVFVSVSPNMNTLFVQNNVMYLLMNNITFPGVFLSLIGFFRQVFTSSNTKPLINKLWNANISIYFLIIILSIWSYINPQIPYDVISSVFVLMILIDTVILTTIVIKSSLKGNIDAKIFTVGFIIFAVIPLFELSIMLVCGRVPSLYKWGILIFVAALILILGRRFSDAHAKLVVYSNELKLKNEELNIALDELQKSKEEVDELNKTLEIRVEERTMELKDAMDSLIKTRDQLIQTEKMAAIGGLVIGVAHEINTPVGVGVTAASHLEVETKEMAELYQGNNMKRSDFNNYINLCLQSAGMILSNLKRAAELIKSFKRVAVDQTSGEKRRFKVGEYINEILVSLSPELKKVNHQVEVNCPEDLELDSYPGAFSQVVTNLVMNSFIHAYDEGESGILRFDIEKQEDAIIFMYSDNGKGIKKEFLTKIFDPFYTTKRSHGGTGLGLNIVYNIVTQTFKGEIKCDSEEGNGTRFIVSIPIIFE